MLIRWSDIKPLILGFGPSPTSFRDFGPKSPNPEIVEFITRPNIIDYDWWRVPVIAELGDGDLIIMAEFLLILLFQD